MATSVNQKPTEVKSFSGATQRQSSKFLRQENEQELGINADYSRTGGVQKIAGYEILGNTITTSSTTSTSTSTTTSTTTSSSSTSTSTSTSSTTTGGA